MQYVSNTVNISLEYSVSILIQKWFQEIKNMWEYMNITTLFINRTYETKKKLWNKKNSEDRENENSILN